jgi:iron-sulfur cluster insertion protein
MTLPSPEATAASGWERCLDTRVEGRPAAHVFHSVKEEDAMITMTTAAEEKIRELMQEEQDTIGLRVFVKGGGCHGYQYGMSFESKMSDDDTVIEKGDVKVIMDSQSAPLLVGCEVDYVDALQGSGFAIKNPQAKTTCGCGSSFSA